MVKRLKYWSFLVIATLMSIGCTNTQVSQRSLFGTESKDSQAQFENILDSLGVLGIELRRLEETYQEVKTTDSLMPFAEQFAIAQDAYLLQDYTTTATLLQPIVSESSNQSEPLYRAATYYLADSHFQIGNRGIARLHFAKMANQPELPYGFNSITRLLQMALKEGNWPALEPHLNILLGVDSPDATAAYCAAHGLIKLERYQDASLMASRVPKASRWYTRSLYLKAVASIHQGELTAALKHLSSVTQLEADGTGAAKVKELAQLATARILFELKDYSGAQNAYQDIPRDSPHFSESLYEIAHTYVGNAQSSVEPGMRMISFQNASNALDLLLLFAKNQKTIAEASLLKANILLWLQRRGESKELLTTIQQRYTALGESFQELPEQVDQYSGYYEMLSKKRGLRAPDLPEMVVNHLESGPELNLSRNVVQEVEDTHEIIRSLKRVITDLNFKIKYDPNGYFLKSGQQAYKQVDRLRMSIDKLSRQLIDVDIQLLRPSLDEGKRQDLDTRVDEMAAVKTELYILEGRTRTLVRALKRAPIAKPQAAEANPKPRQNFGKNQKAPSRQAQPTHQALRLEYQVALKKSQVLRSQYVTKLRRVQDFLQANHKTLAQTTLSSSKGQASLTPRLNQLSAQRLKLSKSLANNRHWQEQARRQTLNPNWTPQDLLNGLNYLNRELNLFPQFLKPRVRDWLNHNIQTCVELAQALPNRATEEEKKPIQRRTLELLIHGLNLMEAELNHSYHQTFELERATLLARPDSSEENGLWLALSLERAGKVLNQLRTRATALESKIKLHTESRLNHMKVLLTRELRNLNSQHAALTLASARTKRIVGKVANLSLQELGRYVSDLLMRCDVGHLDITWQAKIDKVRKVDAVLVDKRKALKEHDRTRDYLMSGSNP